MTQTIKLTCKRQATFPARLCRELGVKSGDELILERKIIDGRITWMVKPKKEVGATWFGGLQKFARGKDHDMEAIRASIGRKVAKNLK